MTFSADSDSPILRMVAPATIETTVAAGETESLISFKNAAKPLGFYAEKDERITAAAAVSRLSAETWMP